MNKLVTLSAILALTLSLSAKEAPTPGFNNKIPDAIMTPNKVETSIGDLNFVDGRPTDATVQKVYDNLDTMRGVDVFLNFVPAGSVEAMRAGMARLGVDSSNKVMIVDTLLDSNPIFLTGNTDTVYAAAMLDLEKDGVTVVEIPAGAGPGTLNDAFFRFVVDMGAPGPDRKKGGTYVILPPEYEGELKPTPNTFKDNTSVKAMIGGEERDVWIAQSRSYNNWLILRGFLVDGKPNAAVNMWKEGLKIYPLSQAKNPPKMEHYNFSKEVMNTVHANNFEFYKEIDHMIQKEPIGCLSPELRGQAASIGIVKGKEFNPDERMTKILTDSMAIANATARTIAFAPRDSMNAYVTEDRQWIQGFVGGDYRWLNGDGMSGRNLDARTMYFYLATVNTPAMVLQIPGIGSNYAFALKDKEKKYLDGSKNYKLHVPANVPAKDFWSVVLYDPQTRSELQTDQPYPSINNKIAKLDYNEDGSVDLYFGPTAPKGHEANWIQTEASKGWFTLFRFYGPLKPWFDKSWKLGDIEEIK